MSDKDWLTDETMSATETMRRFAELQPEPTAGPAAATTTDLPPVQSWGGGLVLERLKGTWDSALEIRPDQSVSVRN